MSQQGWIKLHRQIKECYVWEYKEPFDRRSAWIDLLLSANHQDKKILLGNEPIEVKRGSFITSELKLMERWKWSKTKVRSFLDMLEKDGMIQKNSDKKKTTINIVNYSIYQEIETTERPQKDHRETTERPQKDTNKNDKNDKNDKNEKECKECKESLSDFSDNSLLNSAIKEFIKMRKANKKVMTDNAINLMIKKLDKIADNDTDKITILNNSIENCWQGIFPLKDGEKTGTNIGDSKLYTNQKF